MWPVGVIIDEADAFLGDRNQQGDSGTSNRVFAQFATFMGNTEYRGKILWFLITSRPDLLPIDLKRQGRAEEHLALFYPETEAEYEALFKIMLKKSGLKTTVQSIKEVVDDPTGLSGADIEAILARAALIHDSGAAEGDGTVSAEVLQAHLRGFHAGLERARARAADPGGGAGVHVARGPARVVPEHGARGAARADQRAAGPARSGVAGCDRSLR